MLNIPQSLISQFEIVNQIIEESGNILITPHRLPDGDAVGSALALYLALKRRGKKVMLACDDAIPDPLYFLTDSANFKTQAEISDLISSRLFDLLITVDVASIDQLGHIFSQYHEFFAMIRVINIDHHQRNSKFGNINMVFCDFASNAEILFEFFSYSNDFITEEIAECLMTGLITDTRHFQTPNTNQHALATAAVLLSKGANLMKISSNLALPPDKARYFASLLIQLHIVGNDQVAWLSIQKEEVDKDWSSGITGELASYLSNLRDVKLGIVFLEEKEGIKISFRSRFGLNLPQIARKFGGNGTHFTAGCYLHGVSIDQAVNLILNNLDDYL